MQPVRVRGLDGFFVAGVGVTRHTGARIVSENALESRAHFWGAVSDDDLSGV